MCRHRLLFVHLGSLSLGSDWLSAGCSSGGGGGGGEAADHR